MANQPTYDFPLPHKFTAEINGQKLSLIDAESLDRVLMSIYARVNVLTGAAPNGVTFKGPLNTGGHIINGGVNSASPTPDEFVTFGHIQSNYKAQSVVTPNVPASGTATVVLTWDTPFADANYIPQVSVLAQGNGTASLTVHHIQVVSRTQVIVVVQNGDSSAPHSGTLYVTAQHL